MKLRGQVVGAIFKRNFSAYFSGMLGYLFIIVFVVAGGFLAFNTEFFTANEPNLDQLTKWYPVLLLFFVPAITMSVWADERRSGTDELLFTLPATDLEVLLGKYFAVLAVYTVALLFSCTYMVVLSMLGNPDWGLMIATYFGYWLAGAALLAAGMLASLLTPNMTVAFVLGIIVCAVPVFAGFPAIGGLIIYGLIVAAIVAALWSWNQLAAIGSGIALAVGVVLVLYFDTTREYWNYFSDSVSEFGMGNQLEDLGVGVVPMTSVIYFIGFTVLMLYLNLVLMSQRHWKSDQRADHTLHYLARTVCLGVILTSLVGWAGYLALRVDATSERLFTLAPSTKRVLSELDSERPISLQVFISPEVPADYLETKKRLTGLLRQFDDMGGKNLEVRYVDVELFTKEAEEAEQFGIRSVPLVSEVNGRRKETQIYMGAVAISSYDKVVVPFFGKALPIEYELTRTIQTVANEKRRTVGILRTDAGLLDGTREWQIVTELKKQYDVEEISPTTVIDVSKFDVLLVGMPSSLTQPEMQNLVNYVEAGNPVLVFDDPFPMTFGGQGGVSGAPKQPKPSQGGGMMMGGRQPPPTPKADGGRASSLLNKLGINWVYDRIAFDNLNPHPEFEFLPKEYIFVTRNDESPNSFNNENEITSGLQELIVICGGTVQKLSESNVEFQPLLSTGESSGLLDWDDFVDTGFSPFTMQQTANLKRDPLRKNDSQTHTLAARIKSEGALNVNAVYVADIDMISDFFFQERNLGNLAIRFDNVTFVLNAVDSLMGDDEFIELRSRRPMLRTLQRVDVAKGKFLEESNNEQEKADIAAKKELKSREKELKKRVEEIQNNEDLDQVAKVQMLQQAQAAESQRMALAKAKIENEKEEKVHRIEVITDRNVKEVETSYRFMAIVLPAVPAMLLGMLVFTLRWFDEKNTFVETRRRL